MVTLRSYYGVQNIEQNYCHSSLYSNVKSSHFIQWFGDMYDETNIIFSETKQPLTISLPFWQKNPYQF